MLDELRKAYQGKTVLLTGHTGFKGTWMTHILNFLGAKVIGYALRPEKDQKLFNLLQTKDICHHVIGDIRDMPYLMGVIDNHQPDYIFHFAAQALVLHSYQNPKYTYEANVMGTLNVLECLRNTTFRSNVVVITTDKVYENLEQSKPYSEGDALGGFDPYSSSKACAEIVASSYTRSFFPIEKYEKHRKRIVTARSGNVIGGGDWSDNRIIPDLIRSLEKNETLKIRNPKSVRPWQHVLEPLNAYLLLGSKLNKDAVNSGSSFNFGPNPNDELSVEELIKISIATWGSGKYEIEQNPNQPHEAGLLKLSIEKAKKELNWTPKYNAKQAIEKTIDWYKRYKDSPIETTLNQIKAYYE